MTIFDTKKAMLEFLGKKTQDYLKNYLDWEPPYDNKDAEELWEKLRGEDNKFQRPLKQRENKFSKYDITTYGERGFFMESFLSHLPELARKALGITSPIPFNNLEQELQKLEDSISDWQKCGKNRRWIAVSYPQRDWIDKGGLHIWTTDLKMIPDVTIDSKKLGYHYKVPMKFQLESVILEESRILNCHPSACLAWLLCDRPIYEDVISAVIDLRGTERISIYVMKPEIPIWIVQHLYSKARYIALNLSKKKQVANIPKPRDMSSKVVSLLHFIEGNKGLNWNDKLSIWNKEHPNLKYSNVNSIRVSYYRAIKAL